MEFEIVAEYFEKLEGMSSRLEMTTVLSEFLKRIPATDIDKAVYLLQGMLAPSFKKIEIGMGEKFVIQAISKISGYARNEVEAKYKELGDLGLVAEELSEKRKQQTLRLESLSLSKVYSNLYKIATSSGQGSQELKIKLLAELLNSAKPKEAKYITRVPIGNLRLGIGDPTIMDSLSEEFVKEVEKDKKLSKKVEKELKQKKEEERKEEFHKKIRQKIRQRIEEKYNIHPDLGSIAKILKEKGLKGLKEIEISPGTPIRPTLAERLPNAEEIVKKIGKCAVESKYDGFRLQIHKNKEKVVLFSRQSENMSEMFPEIVEGIRKQVKAKSAIMEGEALAFNEQTGEFFPFQVTIQRKRKYEVEEKKAEFPLKIFLFDLMYLNGKNLMEKPFKERRKKLEETVKKGETVDLTDSIVTDKAKKIEEYFEENIEKGLEGIIAKDLEAKYIAGARKYAWIKLKRSYKGELQDSIDAVILGYFKGRGKRTSFGLGGLLSGVYDEKHDKFTTIAKIGTGMSEETMQSLEKMLSKIAKKTKPARVDSKIQPDFWVEPKYVIEVVADEITRSPIHTTAKEKGKGLALRFPRLIKIRQDKKAEECTKAKEIEKMYKMQKKVEIAK